MVLMKWNMFLKLNNDIDTSILSNMLIVKLVELAQASISVPSMGLNKKQAKENLK